MLLLSGISWLGKPLVDQIEPNPIAVTGNFLVLRAPAEAGDPSGVAANQTWADLLKDRNIDFAEEDTRLVPIPTGGVFAEAVLGRSNAAEKLDITRFWNWQDSPIPLQPPEIAPVATGTRATPEDLLPGQLGAPVVTIQPPTPLPEPAGLGAVLGALASANLFRDMSGLAGHSGRGPGSQRGHARRCDRSRSHRKRELPGRDEPGDRDGEGSRGHVEGHEEQRQPRLRLRVGEAILGRDLRRRSQDQPGARHGPPGSHHRRRHHHSSRGRGAAGARRRASDLRWLDRRDAGRSSPVLPRARLQRRGFSCICGHDRRDHRGARSLGDSRFAWRWPDRDHRKRRADPRRAAVLWIIRADAAGIGTSLQGVDLLPMHLHDNNDFASMAEPYPAWTNSSRRIYVNIPWFVKFDKQATDGGATSDEAFQKVRAAAVYVLRHESNHVTQFQGNGDQPPATFGAMMTFEQQAYTNDETWLGTPAVTTYFLNTMGAKQIFVDTLAASAKDEKDQFDAFIADGSLNTDAKRRDAMKAKDLLPQTIRGNKNYKTADMYRTRVP